MTRVLLEPRVGEFVRGDHDSAVEGGAQEGGDDSAREAVEAVGGEEAGEGAVGGEVVVGGVQLHGGFEVVEGVAGEGVGCSVECSAERGDEEFACGRRSFFVVGHYLGVDGAGRFLVGAVEQTGDMEVFSRHLFMDRSHFENLLR